MFVFTLSVMILRLWLEIHVGILEGPKPNVPCVIDADAPAISMPLLLLLTLMIN